MNSGSDKPVIAVVTNQISEWQVPILEQFSKLLGVRGYRLLCISGGAITYTSSSDNRIQKTDKAIYESISSYEVTAFILLTGTIGNHELENELVDFVRPFRRKPVISFGANVSGVSSVVVDNIDSMRSLMEHMTADPDHKRFVFIRGYPNVIDSIQREQVFRQTLLRKNIAVEESLIINGNFSATDSYYELDQILQDNLDIDAVVAANDPMALNAIHALHKYGLRVPEDVIVSGFDNGWAAVDSVPPLTTVNYSLSSRVNAAVEELFRQIERGDSCSNDSRVLLFPGTLVVRGSSRTRNSSEQIGDLRKPVFDALDFKECLKNSLKDLRKPHGASAAAVIDDVVAMLVNGSEINGTELSAALEQFRAYPEDVFWWRHLHNQIGSLLQNYGPEGQSPVALRLISKILTQIHEGIWNIESEESYRRLKHHETKHGIRQTLAAANDHDSFKEAIALAAQKLNCPRWYICLYKTPGTVPDTEASLYFSSPNVDDVEYESHFSINGILPGNYVDYFSSENYLIVQPLSVGGIQYGYMVLEMDEQTYFDVRSLAESVCSTLVRIRIEDK